MKGYQLNEVADITSAMEDYLEMICRMARSRDFIRISELAESLHVKPPSASKMTANLKDAGFVEFEKYGYIKLTEKGLSAGGYLLYRHDVLNEFLCLVNGAENETEQVEKIEHFLNRKTVDNINKINELIKKYRNVIL